MEPRKKPSKEALDNAVKVLIPYIIEMLEKERKNKCKDAEK